MPRSRKVKRFSAGGLPVYFGRITRSRATGAALPAPLSHAHALPSPSPPPAAPASALSSHSPPPALPPTPQSPVHPPPPLPLPPAHAPSPPPALPPTPPSPILALPPVPSALAPAPAPAPSPPSPLALPSTPPSPILAAPAPPAPSSSPPTLALAPSSPLASSPQSPTLIPASVPAPPSPPGPSPLALPPQPSPSSLQPDAAREHTPTRPAPANNKRRASASPDGRPPKRAMISFNRLEQTPQGLEEIRPMDASDTLAATWSGDIEGQGIFNGAIPDGVPVVPGDAPVVAEVTSTCPIHGSAKEAEQGESSNGITRRGRSRRATSRIPILKPQPLKSTSDVEPTVQASPVLMPALIFENTYPPPHQIVPIHEMTRRDIEKTTRRHTRQNKLQTCDLELQIVRKNIPRPSSPNIKDRKSGAARDRARRREIEEERGVALGPGDDENYSPNPATRVKWSYPLEYEGPRRGSPSEATEMAVAHGILTRKPRLDAHGNYIDPWANASKEAPTERTKITVSRVIYKGERTEKKPRA